MFYNKDINFFAKTDYHNEERIFGIKTDDRRRHMFVVGKAGTGKTSMIQNMAIQDIRNGKGVAIIDPHGGFAEKCLEAVPGDRINDVVYFNPADIEYPMAMNIMEKVDPEHRQLIASELVGIFKKLWADSWNPRIEYLLKNTVLALLEDTSPTLLGINKMLIDKEYRAKVVEKVTDRVVKTFWADEFTKYYDQLLVEAISPIQNKIEQFLSSSLIRNIVGQTKAAFNVREIMDNEQILIMNLSKEHIGEDNSAILRAMMIIKIQLAAMGRVDMAQQEKKDFYLYVDELPSFTTESFEGMLSEARKYRLNLIIAHQQMTQLDEHTRSAVLENVGTIASFKIDAGDSEMLEKEFEPIFYANDLVNIPKYNICLKLMIDGATASPFSARALEPIDTSDTKQNVERVIEVSRLRYGVAKAVVENKINGFVKQQGQQQGTSVADVQQIKVPKSREENANSQETQVQGSNPPVLDGEVLTKNEGAKERKMFESKCWGCSVDVEVPFEPDGVRPVFCKDCLKNYRREQSKLQEELQEKERMTNPQVNLGGNQGNNRKNQGAKGSFQQKATRQKQEVDKEGLRELISQALKKKSVSK